MPLFPLLSKVFIKVFLSYLFSSFLHLKSYHYFVYLCFVIFFHHFFRFDVLCLCLKIIDLAFISFLNFNFWVFFLLEIFKVFQVFLAFKVFEVSLASQVYFYFPPHSLIFGVSKAFWINFFLVLLIFQVSFFTFINLMKKFYFPPQVSLLKSKELTEEFSSSTFNFVRNLKLRAKQKS